MGQVYGNPYWLIHRPDYHRLLHEAALENGCEIRVKSRVTSIDESVPSLTLKSGETLTADIIIGADGIRHLNYANPGIKSIVRDHILDQKVEPRLYGECAYRATVPAELLVSEPELRHLIEQPVANCWIGPGRHLIAYPIQHATKYNIVMVHPGVAVVEDRWNEPGILSKVLTYDRRPERDGR
jgi:salicylate hydroxylase